MKIYQPGTRGRRTHYVCPGNEFPNSQFLDANGKAIQFAVKFIEGMAEVDSGLGEYMIDKGIAKASPIIFLGDL
jgi:hypothetical protein